MNPLDLPNTVSELNSLFEILTTVTPMNPLDPSSLPTDDGTNPAQPKPWQKPPQPGQEGGTSGPDVVDGSGAGDLIEAGADVASGALDAVSGVADAAGGLLEGAGSALDVAGGCADGCSGCSLALLLLLTAAASSAMALFR